MEINAVNIINYRSIKNQTINFLTIGGKNCSILVGINEGGKSTILKAINAINETFNYNVDCNKDAKKDSKQIEIEYIFDFNQKYFKDKLLGKKLINEELYKLIKFNSISQRVIVENTEQYNQFEIDVEDRESFCNFIYHTINKTIHSLSELYNGTEKLTKENIKTLLPGYIILNKYWLENFLESNISGIMYVPKIIFWKSSNKYLINEAIDLKLFKDDHNISIPLRNIFYISEINNIKERIELIEKDNEARDELSDELSEKITKYVNEVWPEHKIKLEVKIEESLNCRVNVIDNDNPKKRFIMDQRSDGFKQFISILLNLSVENKKEKLKNYIILLDEPEVHLHPSGIKYLKDELLEIAKNNTVILSTHSIYMIDKTALNRHYKIDKINGETIISPIENNPYKEEVIYESLGTSILEHVKSNMILVEGKTDKDIFDSFTELFKNELSPLDIGVISADSVDKIETYAKFFDGKLVKGFVLLDSDKAGKGQKTKLLSFDNYSDKNVLEINDIKNTKIEATLEDLLPFDIIIREANLMYDSNIIETSLDKNKPILEQIKKQLKDLHKIGNSDHLLDLKGNIIKSILSDLKSLSADEVKKKYKKYFEFISKFHEKIKKY